MNPAPVQGLQQTARPLAGLLAAIARLFARRHPDPAPSLHTGWTIQQIVTEEYRILDVLNYELSTHTPAAWIEVFEQRFSLWRQQQCQQSRRPPPCFAHGAHVSAEAYVRDQPFTVVSRPSHVGAFCVVPLWCVLDVSQAGRSPLEVTQRRFVPSGCAPLHFSLSFVTGACFRSVFVTSTWRASDLIRVFQRFLLCPASRRHGFTCHTLCLAKKKTEFLCMVRLVLTQHGRGAAEPFAPFYDRLNVALSFRDFRLQDRGFSAWRFSNAVHS